MGHQLKGFHSVPASIHRNAPLYKCARCVVNEERVQTSAVKLSIGSTIGFHNHGPTRAFSWLKAPTRAFTFKTLLRHYAKWALTPRSLNVKLGP